jgi:hypothetical protein
MTTPPALFNGGMVLTGAVIALAAAVMRGQVPPRDSGLQPAPTSCRCSSRARAQPRPHRGAAALLNVFAHARGQRRARLVGGLLLHRRICAGLSRSLDRIATGRSSC